MSSQSISQLRRADLTDASMLAHLMNMVSGGALASKFGIQASYTETWLDVARRSIGQTDTELSYVNCIVYEINGDIAGMVLLNWLGKDVPELDFATIDEESRPANQLIATVPGSLLIRELGVFEQHRKKGIAQSFLNLAENFARSKFIEKLSLTVHETNTNAIKLYERFGFELIDSRPILKHDFWGIGSKLLLMTKAVV